MKGKRKEGNERGGKRERGEGGIHATLV